MAHSFFDAFSGLDGQQTSLSGSLLGEHDEILADDDDLFQCGKCKKEFRRFVDFLSHKQSKTCKAKPSDIPSTSSPAAFENTAEENSPAAEFTKSENKTLSCHSMSQSPTSLAQNSVSQSYIVSDDFFSQLEQPLNCGLGNQQQNMPNLNSTISGISISYQEQDNPILPQIGSNESDVFPSACSVMASSDVSPAGFSNPTFSRSNNSAFSVPSSIIQLQSFDTGGELVTGNGSINIGVEGTDDQLGSTHILDAVTVDLSQQSLQTFQLTDGDSLQSQVVSQILQLPQYSLSLDGQVLMNQEPLVPNTQVTPVVKPIAARPTSVKKDGYAIIQTSPELQALSSANNSTSGVGKKTTKNNSQYLTPLPPMSSLMASSSGQLEETQQTGENYAAKEDKSGAQKKKLKCQFCDKPFIKNFDLQQHVRSHTGEKPFQCIVCGRAFAQKSNVKKHMQTHKVWPKGPKTLPTEPIVILEGKDTIVTKDTEAKDNQLNNEVTVVVNNSYQCQYCNQMFTTYFKLKSHMKEHKNEQVYKCIQEKCGMVFYHLDQYLLHSKTHENEIEYTCHQCNKTFENLFDLGVHQYSHSLYPNQGPKPVFREYKCTLCYSKYSSASALRHHMETSTHNFKCTECNKKFTCERFLRRHISIHSSLATHECEECGKKFKTEHYLKMHMSVHSSELNFICEVCNAAFNRKDKLKRHMSIHDEIKKYHCPFKMHSGCSKAFSRSDKLKAHILSHSTVKPFQCKKCNKQFSRRPHLTEHLKKHAGEYKFRCPTCNKGFLRNNLFRNHRCHAKYLKVKKMKLEEAQAGTSNEQIEEESLTIDFSSNTEGNEQHAPQEDGCKRARRTITKPKKLTDDIVELPVKPALRSALKRPPGRPRKFPISQLAVREEENQVPEPIHIFPRELGGGYHDQLTETSGEQAVSREASVEKDVPMSLMEKQETGGGDNQEAGLPEAELQQPVLVASGTNLRLVETDEGLAYLYDEATQQFIAQVTGLNTASGDDADGNLQQSAVAYTLPMVMPNSWYIDSGEGQTGEQPKVDETEMQPLTQVVAIANSEASTDQHTSNFSSLLTAL